MAHLAIFRRVFVEQQKRLSEADYAELVALCQVIPGPASSQAGLALGYRFGGVQGAFAAWLGFTLPSAILMGLGAYLWLGGHFLTLDWLVVALKLVAVGIVTQALIGMWGALCIEREQRIIALLAAILFYLAPNALTQVGLIACAFAVGAWRPRLEAVAANAPVAELSRSLSNRRVVGLGLLALVVLSVIGLSLVPMDGALWTLIRGHFTSGALVFGGGHVVLPLLQAEFVPPLGQAEFLAGYGLVQAMPGPLFTLASYLGVLLWPEAPILAATLALVMIFVPGLLLLAAAAYLGADSMPWLRPRLQYVNAVVVGLLLSVLVNPIFTESVTSGITTALAMISLLMAVVWKRSPLEIVGVLVALTWMCQLLEWL